jgi:glycine hydroxymethyltransferase
MVTSGIRIGTPAITTRGLTELQSQQIAHWIDEAIRNRHNSATLANIKKEVARLCTYFPVYDKYIPPMDI